MKHWQSTLADTLTFSGIAVHSGCEVSVTLDPAPVDTGIVFVQQHASGEIAYIPAKQEYIGSIDHCTSLLYCGSDHQKYRVETIEHLMAALSAARIDNLMVLMSGDELPILDGGSLIYMTEIMRVGITKQQAIRRYLRILDKIEVSSGSSFASFSPADQTQFEIEIAFSSSAIGEQSFSCLLETEVFMQEIAPARTFGFLKDAQLLQAAGLAKGSSLDNSIIIGLNDEILNPSGLFFQDEFVRHKMLDAIGDTALLSYPFLGKFYSYRGGHRLNVQAVQAVLAHPSSYEIVDDPELK